MVCRGPTRVIHVIPGFQRPAQVNQPHADAPDVEKMQDKVDVAPTEEVSRPGSASAKLNNHQTPQVALECFRYVAKKATRTIRTYPNLNS